MQVDVVNIESQKVGTVELPDSIFGVNVNEALLWEQVKAQRASWRSGTHDTKTRGRVSGGGAKPYRQKGTGNARQGSKRAPNHVGGGVVFGPHPRDYGYRLPRSARKAALRSVLSLRLQEKSILVLDEFPLDQPKTKAVVTFLNRVGSRSTLIIDGDNANLRMSMRNIPQAKFLVGHAVNVYDVLNHEKLVLTKAAVKMVTIKAQTSTADIEAAV